MSNNNNTNPFAQDTQSTSTLIEQVLQEFIKYNAEQDWTVVSQDACQVSTKSLSTSSFHVFRGCMKQINSSVEKFLQFYLQYQHQADLYKQTIDLDCVDLEQIFSFKGLVKQNDEMIIMRHRYIARSVFVSDRDFVFARDVISKNGKTYIIGASIPKEHPGHDYVAPVSGVVRGMVKFCWILENSDGKLNIEYMNHTDPYGWLPAVIFNQSLTNQALTVKHYAQHLQGSK